MLVISRWVRRAGTAVAGFDRRANGLGLVALVVAGAIVRLALLPTNGFRTDTDQVAGWIHSLAVGSLGTAYRVDITWPPVMVYVFSLLAAVEPAFRTATDAAATSVRVAIKTPASLADLGLAAGAWWYLRERPQWALLAAAALLFHPALVMDSAWWGQFDAIYILGGLVALLLARADRPRLVAVVLAIALMTKPQAIPFVVPFAAWFVARHGLRETALCAAMGALTIVALWIPFLADDGVARYLATIAHYQDDLFASLSHRAWNPWWIVQSALSDGYINDTDSVIGPVTYRLIGYALFAFAEIAVFVAVWRRPTLRALTLGLATSVLAGFLLLTTMHERYALGAIVFLILLVPDPRIRWAWLVASAAITADQLLAIPASPLVGRIPLGGGWLGIIGAIVMTGVGLSCIVWLLRGATERPRADVLESRGDA